MTVENSKNLYITRKRKKWKFAHFDSYANCFMHQRGAGHETIRKSLLGYFKKDQSLVLEIAAGNAQFSLALARKYPNINFIAIDIKSDRLYTSAKQAMEESVENIAFLRMGIDEIEKFFLPHSVAEIWLTFPDPHPKKRASKHRLSHTSFLRQYRSILKETGRLKFKTDNRELFNWSLEQFVTEKWHILELSFDLHESDLPDEYKIMTYYEQRFTAEGISTNYATCSVPTLDIS